MNSGVRPLNTGSSPYPAHFLQRTSNQRTDQAAEIELRMRMKMTPFDKLNKKEKERVDDEVNTSSTHVIRPDQDSKQSALVPPLPAEAKGFVNPDRHKREISEEDKMEQRRAANRRSALESRRRRAILLGTYCFSRL